MLAILAVAAASAAPPCGTTRPPKPHSVLLANEKDKLLVAAVAKGGATVATQLMLRREGLLETALRHRGSHGTGWIHDYRHVYARQPNHRPPRNATATCRDRAWSCVAIIRSPLDRVVSSYQHAMVTKLGGRLGLPGDCPFRRYVAYVASRLAEGRANVHVGSQVEAYYGPPSATMRYLPVETIGLGGVVALNAVAPRARLDASNLTSSHYRYRRPRARRPDPDATADAPWSAFAEGFPPYEDFFRDSALRDHVLGCLFRADAVLYARACAQPWLRACAACARECDARVQKVRGVRSG